MGRQSLRPFVDKALGGTLYDFIATRREQGASFEQVARDLANEHDVNVSAETVRVWSRELAVPDPRPAA